jgi:cbb3-type cytochrome oxidase subunit 1
MMLQDPSNVFLKITKVSLMFIRLTIVGDILILLGHLAFAFNVIRLVRRFYQARAAAAYAAATAEIGAANA